ncbi:hypothetical protein CAC42_2117 [Sphaceloma murrayae]|uniref:KANL3/Tex30 alpha/beta hydrolase-like domain-containing protein n=1 Tax=Sphaceloma murrayae TaxID=2082308 RepID=A0A2K1QI92_9PEZI|nr:hypothetical protein CAC42_2117 [Sphaceloma murrayae]
MPRRSKRNRNHTDSDEKTAQDDTTADLTKSVLGGLKGGRRLDGSEDKQQGTTTFKVPFNDKFIICQKYHGPSADENASLIFTHGAGGGIANPATVEFAKGFASAKSALCFQGTMNLKNRVKCFTAVLDEHKAAMALGGRSMGARAATITATDHADTVSTLILVSFPLTSERGGESREDILLNIPGSIDVLFITGDGDKMCNMVNLSRVRRQMKARSWSVVIRGADHSMSLKDKRGVAAMRAKTGQIAAEWLQDRPERTEVIVSWDAETSEIEVGEWQGGLGRARLSKKDADDNPEESEPEKPQARKRQKKRA